MLSSCNDIKEAILRQYDEVISIFDNCGELPASLRETIEKLREKLIEKRKEFSEEFCQVVVSGEISAGKSSLLNFLIGRDILPTSTLETKSIPCRLRYATEKRAQLVDDSGNVIEDINYDENENKEALNRLRKIIKGGELVPGLSFVEIFLNECSLEGNVVLVDTPGIKEEDDDDNSQLFTHLRKASALIYIIKTDNAGGTHKLFKIMKRVQELKQDGDSDLSPDCMLYVCNKWDNVEDNEEEMVFEEIQSRLRCNGIEVREGQLLKLSIKKERKNKRKGKPTSNKYKLFIEKLRGLISLAVKDRYRRECQWLEKALNDVISLGNIIHETLSKTLYDRQRLMTDYQESVASLKQAVDTPKRNYCREVIIIYTTLSANLHEHLRTEKTSSDIIRKCKSEMERKRSSLITQTFEELEKVVVQTFQQIINEEITQWREKNNVDNACAQVCEKVLRCFRMLDKKIEKDLVGYCDKNDSERSSIHMRSAQVSVNGNCDYDPSRTNAENAEREDASFSSTMGSAQVPVNENKTYIRLDNAEQEDNRLHTNESITMSGAQVPITVDEQISNGTKNNKGEEDTRLLITDSPSLRSAQVHVTDDELEKLRIENGEGEDAQLFTNGEKIGLALTAPLWFPIAVTASVFVVPVGGFKILSNKFSNRKAESNFRKVTDERHLAELLQELYKLDTFSEVRFNEEFERNSIRLFNQWLHQQHEASVQVIENISATLQQLAENEKLESEDKQYVERLLQQLKKCQEECCVISGKCCNLLNEFEGPLS